MNLTANEDAVLVAILRSEYTAFNGANVYHGYEFNCDDFQVWSDCIECPYGSHGAPRGKSLSGTISSLSKKGMIVSDGECVMLTRQGFDRAQLVCKKMV